MTSLIEHPYPTRPASKIDPTGAFERAYLEVSGMSGHERDDSRWGECLDPNAAHNRRGGFKQYRRKQIAELRPYKEGDDLAGVSVSEVDSRNGSPKPGDMIARNPKNHADQWLVAAQYFADNFEPVALRAPAEAASPGEYRPQVIYYEEGDRSELVLTDEPCFSAKAASVEVIRSVRTREIIGFAWDGKEPPAPAEAEPARALELLINRYARKREDGLPLDISEQEPEIAEAMRVLARYKVREAGL